MAEVMCEASHLHQVGVNLSVLLEEWMLVVEF
jgi:hypothetical protein